MLPDDVSAVQRDILRIVLDDPGVAGEDIRRRLEHHYDTTLHPSTINLHVTELEDRGLLEREQDGRCKENRATDDAVELMEHLHEFDRRLF